MNLERINNRNSLRWSLVGMVVVLAAVSAVFASNNRAVIDVPVAEDSVQTAVDRSRVVWNGFDANIDNIDVRVEGIGTDTVTVGLYFTDGVQEAVKVPVEVPEQDRKRVGNTLARYTVASELAFYATGKLVWNGHRFNGYQPMLTDCLSGAILGHNAMPALREALTETGYPQSLPALKRGTDYGVIGCLEGTGTRES